MDPFILSMWIISFLLMTLSLIKRKAQTKVSFIKAKAMISSMISKIILVLLLVGFILALIPQQSIEELLGKGDLLSTISAALIGTVTIIPAFVAFPLVGSILDGGASIVVAVSFLTTLTMVGIATFPIEVSEFGIKFAVVRNVLSFIFAIIVALVMGVLI